MTGHYVKVWARVDGSRVQATRPEGHGFVILGDTPEAALEHALKLQKHLTRAIDNLRARAAE